MDLTDFGDLNILYVLACVLPVVALVLMVINIRVDNLRKKRLKIQEMPIEEVRNSYLEMMSQLDDKEIYDCGVQNPWIIKQIWQGTYDIAGFLKALASCGYKVEIEKVSPDGDSIETGADVYDFRNQMMELYRKTNGIGDKNCI